MTIYYNKNCSAAYYGIRTCACMLSLSAIPFLLHIVILAVAMGMTGRSFQPVKSILYSLVPK